MHTGKRHTDWLTEIMTLVDGPMDGWTERQTDKRRDKVSTDQLTDLLTDIDSSAHLKNEPRQKTTACKVNVIQCLVHMSLVREQGRLVGRLFTG